MKIRRILELCKRCKHRGAVLYFDDLHYACHRVDRFYVDAAEFCARCVPLEGCPFAVEHIAEYAVRQPIKDKP